MARKKEVTGQLGLFMPEVEEWTPPDFLPDWTRCPLLVIDTETKDDGINSGMGAGWAFKNWGHIAGFSACNGEKSLYFSLRHPDSKNFDIDAAGRWLKAHIKRPSGTTIFHHAMYDTGWLYREFGIYPDKVDDTMIMATMINEHRRSYSLDNLCKEYGIPGKDKKLLREAAAALGLHPMREIYKIPAKYVGPYGEQDASSTMNLYNILDPIIKEQELTEAYRLECDLVKVIMKMRYRGIRIDENRLDELTTKYAIQRETLLAELSEYVRIGRELDMTDILSGRRLAPIFDRYGLSYPITKLRTPSFESKWLEDQDHYIPKTIALIRKFDQATDKFLTGFISDFIIDGRLHAEIHQLRDDSGGTRSYRLSYSNPPLQQMPQRDPLIGKSIRETFLPEEGDEWCVGDYSQQEPRFTVHYAVMLQVAGWQRAQAYYLKDPNADYHQMVADMASIPRKSAKIINLGLAYGMEAPKLADSLGLSLEDALILLNQYHTEVPYIKALRKICQKKVEAFGFIKLIDGARGRFELWRPKDDWFGPAYPLEVAKSRVDWEGKTLVRADTRDAFNRLIQGSSARQTKKAMLDADNAGLHLMLQMHDDLNFSISDRSQSKLISEIMINAIPLKVPMKVDIEIGANWGLAKEIKEDDNE